MTQRLPEVSEAEAGPPLSRVYDDVRATLGVPIVNLIYRHLASKPGRLEAIWARLRPSLADPATQALALRVGESVTRACPPVAPADVNRTSTAEVATADLARARTTLCAYELANSLNLLVVHALLSGAPGSRSETGSTPPERPGGEILPLADPAKLDARTRAVLDAITAATIEPGEPALVPSLYRHLASAPGLLALIWELVEPLASQLRWAAGLVDDEAAQLARLLPYPIDPVSSTETRAILERFETAMAAMLVVGRVASDAVQRRPGRRSPRTDPKP